MILTTAVVAIFGIGFSYFILLMFFVLCGERLTCRALFLSLLYRASMPMPEKVLNFSKISMFFQRVWLVELVGCRVLCIVRI